MRFDEETFKQEFNQTYGGKYEYLGYEHGKVKFKCNIHNIIQEDTPSHLRSGRGCKICSKEAKIAKSASTTEEFIAKAKAIHGEKYDYSKVRYVKNDEKVTIICPKHGEFLQTPMTHLRGNGCQKCGYETIGRKLKRSEPLKSPRPRKTTEVFIKQATELQNGFYDYSKSVYVNDKTPLVITCPIHGDFLQTPNKHLIGHGCPKCRYEKSSRALRRTLDDVIAKSKAVHGENTYDYSLISEYKNSKTKYPIRCKKHGIFMQTMNAHIDWGQGCPVCGKEKCAESRRLTNEEFIKRASRNHSDMDNYSFEKTDVTNPNENGKVCITCNEHGDFWMLPSNFIHGQGCPTCQINKLEGGIRNLLEEHNIEYVYQKRFGFLGRLSLDFYLPKHKLAIECQGRQHFEPIDYYGGMKAYREQVERDKRKSELCKENNIDLVCYSNKKHHYPYEVITDKDKLLEIIREHEKTDDK